MTEAKTSIPNNPREIVNQMFSRRGRGENVGTAATHRPCTALSVNLFHVPHVTISASL